MKIRDSVKQAAWLSYVTSKKDDLQLSSGYLHFANLTGSVLNLLNHINDRLVHFFLTLTLKAQRVTFKDTYWHGRKVR